VVGSERSFTAVRHPLYPETLAGGFSRVDGVVEFFSRIDSLLTPDAVVVDLGAGRGGHLDDSVPYRRRLQMLRGRVACVIGLDIDPVVLDNPCVDVAHVLSPGGPFPVPDASADLVLADWTFEHIEDPNHAAAEIGRVLKPGGWLCARTPNKWGYIGMAARAVPNSWHARLLRRLQPTRLERDIFPTWYRLNTFRDLQQQFPSRSFEHCSYAVDAEPAYFGASVLAGRAVQVLGAVTPPRCRSILYVFVRKRDLPADNTPPASKL